MSAVSVIGLGAMGSAIARAFASAGHELTVWNRSPERARPFADEGVHCARDLEECIRSSPVAVICVDDYPVTASLLRTAPVAAALRGRCLVQFSTGTPAEARAAEAWCEAQEARYLDGAILAYPREVGRTGLIFLSGKSDVYSKVAPLLSALTSELRYLGERIGSAAGLDVAILFYYICTHLGLTQAALICESEAVSPALLAGVIADSSPSDVAEVRHLGEAIERDVYSSPGASLGVYSAILDRVLAQAHDAGIDDRIPRFMNRIVKRGIEAGFGDEEIVSLIRLLRRERPGGSGE